MSAERPKLLLSPVDCDGCGRCVEVCRAGAIRPGPNYIYVDWARCDGCGKCADLCDRGAIGVRGTVGAAEPALATGGLALGAGAGTGAGGGGAFARAGKSGRFPARLWRPWSGAPGAAGSGEEPPSATTNASVGWTLWEAAAVLGFAIGLQLAQQAVLSSPMIQALTGHGILLARGIVLAFYYASLVAVLLVLAIRRDVGFAELYRLDAPPDPVSIPLGLSMLVTTWVFSMAFRWAAIAAGWSPPATESPSLNTLFGSDAAGMTLTVLVVVLLGPIVEEIVVRGVALGALRERLRRWPAIAVSAAVFAVLHASLWSLVPLTFLGLALGRLAVDRRSLWPAIGLHVFYNAAVIVPAFVIAAQH